MIDGGNEDLAHLGHLFIEMLDGVWGMHCRND